MRRIVMAAIRTKRGLVYVGMRHDECYWKIAIAGFKNCENCVLQTFRPTHANPQTCPHYRSKQRPGLDYAEHWGCEDGFVTDDAMFIGRREAFLLAQENGQLIGPKKARPLPDDQLTSEDLW